MPLTGFKFKRIYTLGPEGTFSNQAATRVGGLDFSHITYCTTLPQITEAVAQDEDSIGVLPIENSIGGTVAPAQDSLILQPVIATAELYIDVHYALISAVPIKTVQRYFCHSVAFNQCQNYLGKQLGQAQVIYTNSNIHSAELFLSEKHTPVAGIVPLQRAQADPQLAPLIQAKNVQDVPHNQTRFLVIRKKPAVYTPDFSKEKTSIYIELHEDRHSLLFDLLGEFHVFSINLCRLESRPSKIKSWQYGFFIDFYNNNRTGACLESLRKLKIDFQILGSFNPLAS